MNICVPKYGIQVELNCNFVMNLVLESPCVMSEIVCSINNQIDGCEGIVFLGDGANTISFSKRVDFIQNPSCVNANSKKVVNALYKELDKIVKDILYVEYCQLNGELIKYLDKIVEVSPYMISIDASCEVDNIALFKMYNMNIESSSNSFCENFINYLRSIKSICGIDIVFVLNIKQFFSLEELSYIYEFCTYNEIYLINIEGYESVHIEHERYYIVDKDCCIIEV